MVPTARMPSNHTAGGISILGELPKDPTLSLGASLSLGLYPPARGLPVGSLDGGVANVVEITNAAYGSDEVIRSSGEVNELR